MVKRYSNVLHRPSHVDPLPSYGFSYAAVFLLSLKQGGEQWFVLVALSGSSEVVGTLMI